MGAGFDEIAATGGELEFVVVSTKVGAVCEMGAVGGGDVCATGCGFAFLRQVR